MRRLIWIALLLILALPTAAYSTTIDFANQGGTISGSTAGLTLTSPITAVAGLSGFTSGTLSIMTGALTSGTLAGTLGGPASVFGAGTLTITSNVFNQTFAFNSATWTLQGAVAGNDQYTLLLFFANGNGSSTQIDIVANGGPFVNIADVKSGNTIIATVVPEPATLGLLGTGLVAVAGLVRRKLKCG
jgi:PEP-CTERM motif-containing protein